MNISASSAQPERRESEALDQNRALGSHFQPTFRMTPIRVGHTALFWIDVLSSPPQDTRSGGLGLAVPTPDTAQRRPSVVGRVWRRGPAPTPSGYCHVLLDPSPSQRLPSPCPSSCMHGARPPPPMAAVASPPCSRPSGSSGRSASRAGSAWRAAARTRRPAPPAASGVPSALRHSLYRLVPERQRGHVVHRSEMRPSAPGILRSQASATAWADQAHDLPRTQCATSKAAADMWCPRECKAPAFRGHSAMHTSRLS